MSSDGNALYYVGVGRRKEAVARIRLYGGERGIVVNGRPFEDYFPRILHQNVVQEPLDLVGASFRVSAKSNWRRHQRTGRSDSTRSGASASQRE